MRPVCPRRRGVFTPPALTWPAPRPGCQNHVQDRPESRQDSRGTK
ncbi:EspF repeat-containing protein [uncultured Mameliella sp.]